MARIKIYLYRTKYTSSGAKTFIEGSKINKKPNVNFSYVYHASSRDYKLSKLNLQLSQSNYTESSRMFLSSKILPEPILNMEMLQ